MRDLAREHARPGRFAVLFAAVASGLAFAEASEDSEASFSARASLDYVPRWEDGDGERDQDVYASVIADWGTRTDRTSGSLH